MFVHSKKNLTVFVFSKQLTNNFLKVIKFAGNLNGKGPHETNEPLTHFNYIYTHNIIYQGSNQAYPVIFTVYQFIILYKNKNVFFIEKSEILLSKIFK